MILLKELKLNNFLSHENTKIKFNETGKLLLDGKSGSGKSSITEAILWTFYGKGRSDNRSLVRRGSKIASASLKLIDNELETIITRSVSSAGKNTLTVTQSTGPAGQFLPIARTGIKDVQDWIENDFLKASYELFTNSVAYPQDNENSFVKASASKRKDLLLEIVRAGNFDDLYIKARNAITANESGSAVTVSKIEGLNDIISRTKEEVDKISVYQKEVDSLNLEVDKKVKEEETLNKKLSDISGIQQKINDKSSLIVSYRESLENLTNQEEKDKETIDEYGKLDIDSAKKDLEKIVVLQQQITDYNTLLKENAINSMKMNALLADKPIVNDFTKDIANINGQIIPLLRDSGSCPSGDKCPFVKPIKSQIEFLTGQIEEKNEIMKNQKVELEFWDKKYSELVPLTDDTDIYIELKKIDDEITELEKSRDVITKYEIFEKNVKEAKERMEKVVSSKEKLIVDITLFENEIDKLKADLKESNPDNLNIEISTLRIEIKELRESLVSASGELISAQKGSVTLKECEKDIRDLKVLLASKNKENEALKLLKEALSPRGIKAVVVDYLVPQLEEKINAILSKMSDFVIRLDTQKGKADGDGVKEGLFITVLNESGEEMSFDNYSGGEKIKLTIAISEALASLMSGVGFRIMDENIISLDNESTQSFVTVLFILQEKFPQLLVVSHIQEIKDMFQTKIDIIKTNGISKINEK